MTSNAVAAATAAPFHSPIHGCECAIARASAMMQAILFSRESRSSNKKEIEMVEFSEQLDLYALRSNLMHQKPAAHAGSHAA